MSSGHTEDKSIPGKPWETIDADIFMLNNKTYLCVVDYNFKFLVLKQMDGLSVESLIKKCKMIFSENAPLRRIMHGTNTNFILENFQDFYRHLKCHWVVSSSYHHQNNRQSKGCLKFVKCTMKKMFEC